MTVKIKTKSDDNSIKTLVAHVNRYITKNNRIEKDIDIIIKLIQHVINNHEILERTLENVYTTNKLNKTRSKRNS